MRIVHVCLSCFYIDGFAYQENQLVAQNVKDGHDVLVIASTETYSITNELTYIAPGEYLGLDGANVIRLPYSRLFPAYLSRKLRVNKGLYKELDRFKPDVVFFHGICGWELITASHYKKNNPDIHFFADTHTDFNNSAKGFVSRFFLHFVFYRTIARIALKQAAKVFCVSVDTLNFAKNFYGISQNKLEFYPLGGEILSPEEYGIARAKVRAELKLTQEHRVFVQTGKMGVQKKLINSLKSFVRLKDESCRFVIVGSLYDDIKDEALRIISSDQRIIYLGWRSSSELQDILCAADVYVQPGTQSATMQMSICCGCVVVLDNIESHYPYIKNNGWLIKDDKELFEVFSNVSNASRDDLCSMQQNSRDLALQMLDYRVLAKRIYL